MSCVGFFAPRTDSAKKYWNRFCWLCHKETTTDKKKCNKCYHVYHVDCLEADSVCNDCKLTDTCARILNSVDHHMLKLLLEKLFSDKRMKNFDEQNNSHPLTAIKMKIENYSTFVAFLDDIKWTTHKCMVVYNEENKMNAMAEQLRMYCIEQVESMQACAKCYLNSIECPDHHIEMACEMDHPILWGLDPTNLLYWPAKCMAVNDSRAIVQFFGNHKTATIDVKDCLLYSREPPTRKTDVFQLDAQNFSTALKESDAYIENLRKKIGEYVYAAVDTPFDASIHFRINNNTVDHMVSVNTVASVPALSHPILVTNSPLTNASSEHQASNKPSICIDMPIIASDASDDQPNASIQTRAKSSTATPIENRKRKATETITRQPSSEPKARKSFPQTNNIQVFSNLMQLNFKEYVDKSNRLCNGIERMENKLDQLKSDKEHLTARVVQYKSEVEKLTNENKQLKDHLQQIKTVWESRLLAAKTQQWCIACGKKPKTPFHCSKACLMNDWRKEVDHQDDL